MAKENLPKIQTTGQLLEYLVSVKKNDDADLDDITRTSHTKWEPVFVGTNFPQILLEENKIRETQMDRLNHSYEHIFNSMRKF